MLSNLKEFYSRFGRTPDKEEEQRKFVHRILNSFDVVLGLAFLEDKVLESEYLNAIGAIHTGFSYKGRDTLAQTLQAFDMQEFFKDSKVYKSLELLAYRVDLVEFIHAIECVFDLDNLSKEYKNAFFKSISKDIKNSYVDIVIQRTGDGATFYPSGAKLLDKKLVEETLSWLGQYPDVLEHFRDGLQLYTQKANRRMIVDQMRFSLEILLKKVLANNLSLKDQISPLGRFLKERGVKADIRNMYTTLLTYYAKYEDECAKHNDKTKENEDEFIIYLTGSFIRFILKAKVA